MRLIFWFAALVLVASCSQNKHDGLSDCRGKVEDGRLVRANVCIVNGPVQPYTPTASTYEWHRERHPVVIAVPFPLATPPEPQ